MTDRRPPAAARALLRLLLPRDVHDAFAGDLEERFHRVGATSARRARLGYWKDVLSPTVLRLRREAKGMPLPPGSSPGASRGDGIVSSLLSDLKFATRMLRKAPGFTAVAVLSLALGIGPNTAIFSLVNAVLFQDWGVGEPEGLIDVYTLTDDGEYFFSRYATYELLAEGTSEVFEDVAQHSVFTGRMEGAGGEVELVLGEMVSGNYFDVMRVPAALGRTFLPEEDATLGTHPVVVLGNDYWSSRFASDPSMVGREVRLNGRPYTVVGVAPAEFRGRLAPGLGTDFWVPFSMYPHLVPSKPGNGDLTISGRVRDGIAPGVAIAAVETLATREDERRRQEIEGYRGRFRLAAFSLADVKLHPSIDGVVTQMAALLLVAVWLVLLVACVNLAGFLLSRATDRRKEMAVRVAMGAGRTAIVRQLLVESLVLSALGGALGLALGRLALGGLLSVEPPLPLPVEIEAGFDVSVLLFTAGTSLVAALLFGLTPALEAMRAPVAATLRDEAGSSGGRRKVGARGVLVATQMTLSTMLLFGAGLFVRSLQAANGIDLGFSTRSAAVVQFDLSANEYTTEQVTAFVDDLVQRVSTRPGVASAGITARMPLGLGTVNLAFDVPGVEPPPNQRRHSLEFAAVTAGYFDALGIEVVEGRAIEALDRDGSPPVAVLSRAAAERFWPGESAVGKLLIRQADGSDALTVVGVVDNVKIWSLSEGPRPYIYVPYFQGFSDPRFAVVARGAGEAGDLAALVRDEGRAIDPEVFLTGVSTLDDHLGYAYFLPRMAAVLLSLVGALALALACLGLYGMVSYGVARRTREMGIRLALGADRQRVIGLVLKGGLTLVGIGAVVGLALSLGLGRAVEGFLYGVGGFDPVTLLAAPAVLALVGALATYLPARRASRVDPVQALRSE